MDDDARLGRREELIWSGLLLGIAALTTASAGGDAVTLALVAGFVAFHAAMVALTVRRPLPGAVGVLHAVGLVGFVLVLVDRSGDFWPLVYALYPQLFLRLGWWAVPAIAATTAATVGQLDVADDELLATVGVSTAMALAIGVAIDAVDRLSRRRQATIVALEAARAEVLERGRAIGTLEERQRLAREMHDTVAQRLVSVVAQLEAAEQDLEAGRVADGLERLGRGRDAARTGLQEARRAVAALRPDLLDGGSGLGAALRVLGARLEAEAGIAATVEVRGDDRRLAPAAEDALVRCAQEALANVRRHAGARAVRAALDIGAERAELVISDDGVGFDTAAGRDGFGLETMRERAAAAGGTAHVTSSPGHGTRVHVRVPLAGRATGIPA